MFQFVQCPFACFHISRRQPRVQVGFSAALQRVLEHCWIWMVAWWGYTDVYKFDKNVNCVSRELCSNLSVFIFFGVFFKFTEFKCLCLLQCRKWTEFGCWWCCSLWICIFSARVQLWMSLATVTSVIWMLISNITDIQNASTSFSIYEVSVAAVYSAVHDMYGPHSTAETLLSSWAIVSGRRLSYCRIAYTVTLS